MKRSVIGAVFTVLIIVSFALSAWILLQDRTSELEYADGFEEDDLTLPIVLDIDPKPDDPQPDINNSATQPDNYITPILLTNISLDAIYTRYGGVIQVSIRNIDDDNNIYVYEFGIIPDWAPDNVWYHTLCGVYIEPNQRRELGLVTFPGPMQAGNHSYNLRILILVQDNQDESWYDWGNLDYQTHYINIHQAPDLERTLDIERYHNLANFFIEINAIVEPYDSEIRNLAVSIAGNYAGNYNIFQLCAIYDYIRDNIAYVGDPAGSKNYWATPAETLEAGGGDCEDHATLLASMVMAIGGTTRMYMTDNHAFTTVYIGDDTSDRDAILTAIEKYYGSELSFGWVKDDWGYWLVADTGSSFYLGGLPVDSVPVKARTSTESLNFNFIEISKLFSVDIVPK